MSSISMSSGDGSSRSSLRPESMRCQARGASAAILQLPQADDQSLTLLLGYALGFVHELGGFGNSFRARFGKDGLEFIAVKREVLDCAGVHSRAGYHAHYQGKPRSAVKQRGALPGEGDALDPRDPYEQPRPL